MKKVVLQLLLLLMLATATTGCWDSRNMRDMHYVSAIGFDWKDGKYSLYIQLMDFASLSKLDGGVPAEPAQMWVGVGSGMTLDQAVEDLYRATEKRIFWGQVSAVLFSERMIEKGIEATFDVLNRYQETRYDTWLYGTTERMEEIFYVTPLFHTSPTDTTMYDPLTVFKQASFVRPILLQELLRKYYDPGGSVILPKVVLKTGSWRSKEETKSLLVMDGAYIVNKTGTAKPMRYEELLGLRWMQEQYDRSQVMVSSNGKPAAHFNLYNASVNISADENLDKLKVNVYLKGVLTELIQQIPLIELEKLAVKQIEEQIRHTYETARKRGLDVYNINHLMYRKYNKKWKSQQVNGRIELTKHLLDEVNVSVKIENMGKYRVKRK